MNAWDPAMSRAINVPFERGDLEEFRSLLRSNPTYLRGRDGTDMWMWSAAMNGNLAFVKALVELGLNVNETNDGDDPDDASNPFCQAEGPILQAAGAGQLEVVRWLLEHGAKINYVVHDKPRCLPLEFAATQGHVDVVKLLVKHGADIHAIWNNHNAITQAEDYGQRAVFDYLHSLGARTLRETTPPDYPRAHQRFLKHMTNRNGPLGKWQLDLPTAPAVSLHVIPVSKKCKMQTLFTVGLSDRRLPQGWKLHACSELNCLLPPKWPLTKSALKDPKWNWPVEWLKRIVNELREADNWPDPPAVFMNGDPPVPLAPNTKLSGWLCVKSRSDTIQGPDFRYIDLHSLFPIYAEERALVVAKGADELLNLFEKRKIPLHVDPRRPNVTMARKR